MTGLSEFEKVFGQITVLNVIEFILAIVFMAVIFCKAKDYIVARHDASKLRDEQLKKVLDAVNEYPKYRAQSIKIQQELEEKIERLTKSQDMNTSRLVAMEEAQNRHKRNELRDKLLRSYRYYTDKERNPAQTINSMEAEAFWALFGDYEAAGGNGYIHTVVQPAMNMLTVVSMEDVERSADQ